MQSHTIALEGNYTATAATATATIANTANTLRQQSRPLSSKRVRENRAKRGFKRVTRMVLASLGYNYGIQSPTGSNPKLLKENKF